jgi:hypothetical protein
MFDGTPSDMIGKYSHKKITVVLKSKEKKSFTEASGCGLSEVLQKNHINLDDVEDIKIEEGKLEEAFSKMVSI